MPDTYRPVASGRGPLTVNSGPAFPDYKLGYFGVQLHSANCRVL